MKKRKNPIYGKKWEAKRLSVMNHYNWECQEEKRYNKSRLAETVHHIYPIEEYPELMYVNWNLLPLTNKNHNRMHKRHSHELTALGLMWKLKRKPNYDRWLKGEDLF